ncbi:hypothetical protein I4U23_012333 [Adineta vaga]|nr:hypothetical protein I4U23_012333 [Adineta vaga]
MEHQIAINNYKCIQFRPKIPSNPYYITIANGNRRSSYVGQNTGVNITRTVSLQYPGYMLHNFNKYTNTTVNTPYDYRSVIHFEKAAFSTNGLPTIEPLVPNTFIGQRDNMSTILIYTYEIDQYRHHGQIRIKDMLGTLVLVLIILFISAVHTK